MADIQSNINVNIDTSNALASIKALQSQISAFHTSMARGGAQATSSLAQQQQKLLDGINATGKFSAQIQNIKTTTESFTTALEKNKLSLGQYFKYSIASTKSFGNMFKTEMNVVEKVARERVKSLQTQYINLGRDANGALKAISIRPLLLDLDNMQTKTAIAAQKQQILNQLLHQGSTNLLNFGKNTQWAGRQLMVGFTIPLSMAGTAAAKAYMDIEKAAIKIKRVYGDLSTSTQETNKAVDSIKALASEYTKYGIAVADTMDMAATAAAMGKTGADLLAQVNEATRLSALGGVDQAQALETTISLTSAFGLSTEQLAGKINYLNAVENQTVTSIEDLTIAIPKAGPVVKQLGGDVEDLAFFLTAMREGGINASEGANALKSGLAALINPTSKASDMLAGFGINIKAIVEGNKGNLKKTVVDFATALNTIDPLNRARAIEQMFGKFQFARISTLLQNVTASGSQASKALALANMSSIQLAAMSRKELDRISASPMYKFQKAIADLQVKIAPVGEAFLKAVTPIVAFASKMLDGFNGMSDQFKNFAVIGVAVLGGLAPVMLMVVGLVANGAANILKFLTQIKSFFNRTSAGQKDLGSSTSYLTTEQIKAEAVAASLDQIHGKLKQTFTSEAGAVDALTSAYSRYLTAAGKFAGPVAKAAPGMFKPVSQAKGFATGGMVRGPGSGTSDSIPANLSNGEAVIDAETVQKNPAIIAALFAGKRINIPGYAKNNKSQFAHVEENARIVPAGMLMDSLEEAEAQGKVVSKKLKDLIAGIVADLGRNFGVRAYGGLGFDQEASLNNRMRNNGAVPVDQFSQDFESRGASKWNKAVKMGGGDLRNPELQAHLKQYDDAIVAGIRSFTELTGSTTITSDQFALIEAAARKSLPPMSNLKTALDTAEAGLFEVRANISQAALNSAGVETVRLPSRTGEGLSDKATGRFSTGTYVRSGGNRANKTSPGAIGDIRLADIARSTPSMAGFEAAGEAVVTEGTKTAVKGAKKKAKIQSPSKEMSKVGEDLAEGAIEGMKTKAKESKAAGKIIYDASNLPSVQSALSGKKTLGPEGSIQVDSYPSPKAQSGRVISAKSPRTASPFMQDLKSSAQNAMPRLRVAKQEFVDDMKGAFAQLKNLFRNGGKDMVDATKSGLIQETPRLRVAGKEAGFDYVTALKGGNGSIAAVVTEGNQKIVSAALKEYSKGGFRIAGAVSLGLDKGIAGSVARGIIAGEKLADSVTDGVAKRTRGQKNLPMGSQGPLEQGGTRGNILQRGKQAISEKASAAKAGYNNLNSKINLSSDTSGTFAKVGAAATTAAFALSGIPGPVGQTVSTILPFIGIMSALSGIMSMFNIQVVAGSVAMFGLTVPILPLIAAIGGLALVIAGAIWWMNSVNDAKAKELKQINATSKAAESAAGALNGLGKVMGVDTTQSGLSQSEASVKGIKSDRVNDVNTLLNSDEYNHGMTSRYIRDLKAVKTDKDRKESLTTMARNLKASGAEPQAIADAMSAIQIKANAGTGRKAIALDPKTYAVGTKATNEAIGTETKANATNINTTYSKLLSQKIKTDTIIGTAEMGLNRKGVSDASKKLFEKNIKDRTNAIKEEIKSDAVYANAVKKNGISTMSNILAVGKAFLTGRTSLKAYRTAQAQVTTGFMQMNEQGKQDTLKAMRESLKDAQPETVAMASTIKDAAAQLIFLQAAAAGGAGAFTTGMINTANKAKDGGVAAFNAAVSKYEGTAQADYKKNNPGVKDDQSGGDTSGTNPRDVLTSMRDAVRASALTNSLMSQNYSSDFISNIASADAATQAYYTDIKNGIPVLNAQGRALYAAYNTKTINEFISAQKGIVAGAALELKARKQLTAAGLSAEDIKTMAARTDVQAALASANATVGAKARAVAVKKVTDALKAEVEATKSLKSAQDIFQESYDKGTAYLSNQEAKINNDFDRSKANLDNKATILKANQAIEDLQNGIGGSTGLNRYNDGLSKLQFREDEINKKYDERAKALTKIATINQRISEQSKGQLSLAQALASGDIAAAAQAAQDMNSANANAAIEDQKTALDNAKQKELDSQVVSINGKLMTRKDIEAASKVIQEQILDIQINQLATAQTALSLAERTRDASLNVISNQKLEWESLKISVDSTTTSLQAYNAALAAVKPGAIATTTSPKVSSTPTPRRVSLGGGTSRMIGLATGGMVPSYYAAGGFAKGTDTVPAMLTPGEFVVRKFAVDNFGVDKLNSINAGTLGSDAGNILTAVTNNSGVSSSSSAYTDASVYNYSVNVNVRSDANPDQIAQAVMTKINQNNGQRIRGNRFNG